MIQCDRIQESLERWLDGELDAVETENVRAHVAGCATCSAARQRFEKIEGALKQVWVVEAPKVEFTSFWHELDRRIHRKIPWYRGLLDQVRGWEGTPRSAWAVPVLIALLLALFSVESYFPFWRSRNNLATVVSIDSHGRNVALLREDESKTTVIWLYQNQEDDDEAAEETPQPGPAF